jgi:hypothetical protein
MAVEVAEASDSAPSFLKDASFLRFRNTFLALVNVARFGFITDDVVLAWRIILCSDKIPK